MVVRYVSNEVRDKAYKDYCDGMKYKDIAEKYGVSLSAVKSWATRYWKVATNKKLQPQPQKVATTKPEKKLKDKLLESVSENDELTEKRRLFCLYYALSHNALQSYLKAYGGDKVSAGVQGCRLLKNVNVAAEVKRLREILRNEIDIGLPDLLQYCLKVIGADIGDYVTVKKGIVQLEDSTCVDTSLIDEVKQGKTGVSIKLADKKWAWEKLEQYLGWQSDAGDAVDMQNYVDALQGIVNEVWDDTQGTEPSDGDV